MFGKTRDADAREGRQNAVTIADRRSELTQDVLRENVDGVGQLDGFDRDDHELVSAQPRHRVAISHHPFQALGGLLQQSVAGIVTQRFVDTFEIVEVDEQDAHLRAVSIGFRQRLFELALKQSAIGKLRQGIVACCSP